MAEQPTLRRRLGLTLMVLYGLGTTIGAGIYALVGLVAAEAGIFAPVSFLIAALLAGFSALSFAELCARFPTSAGEARYVREGFGSARLSLLVGLLVVAAGLVSAAAVANGFAGYLQTFVDLPREASVAGIVVLLGLLAAWGIGESVSAAGVMTLIEAGGLLLVIWVAHDNPLPGAPGFEAFAPTADLVVWSGVLTGSFLAFFAFIGFEDMVNVAEEVTGVTRTLPRAILLTLAITTALYVVLALVAVRTVAPDELGRSGAPLALLYERGGGEPALIAGIALIATVNGALIQIIMASRVLYGLADQGLLPRILARIGARTRTPLLATAIATLAVLAAGVAFEIGALAETTSVIALTVFALVNLALWRLKAPDKTRRPPPPGLPSVPRWVPLVGFLVSAGFALAGALRGLAS